MDSIQQLSTSLICEEKIRSDLQFCGFSLGKSKREKCLCKDEPVKGKECLGQARRNVRIVRAAVTPIEWGG